MAGKRPVRGLLARLVSAGGTLLSRDIAVLTNAIAFNFLLCLFPLLLVVAGFAQRLPTGSRAGSALLRVLRRAHPVRQGRPRDLDEEPGPLGREMEILSLLLIVWGSSGIFMPVEMALNKVWGGRPHRTFWKSRLLAFVMTLAGGLLALVSVTLTVATRTSAKGGRSLPGWAPRRARSCSPCLLFFLIYRLIPDGAVGTRVALRAALWAASPGRPRSTAS